MDRIYAHFQSMRDAKNAVDALKNAGYSSAHLDAVDGMNEEYSAEINFAGTTKGPSLSGLVLKSRAHIFSIDKGPLIASNPMVSGMGSFSEIIDNSSARVIVKVDDETADEAKKIISGFGGLV